MDTKLSSALTRSAKGDLGARILNHKEEMSKNNIQVRGRMVLLMFDDYYKTSIEAGSLYRVEDLLNVTKIGDNIGDLRKFVNRWDATIAGMEEQPNDFVLRDILLRQVRGSSLMKYDIEVFDRAREGTHEKSYKFLHTSMKEMIDRERLRENRNRIAQRQTGKEGKQANAGVAAKPGPRKGSPRRERGRSEEPKKKGICYSFQKGECKLGKKCQYRRESPKDISVPSLRSVAKTDHDHHPKKKERKCRGKRWLRPHARILQKETANVGANAISSMMLLQRPRKRRTSHAETHHQRRKMPRREQFASDTPALQSRCRGHSRALLRQ